MALNRLVDAGVVAVVAIGNDGPDNDGLWAMGAASEVITVAASDDKDTIHREDNVIADYSSRGPRRDNGDDYPYDELKPDVTAPGSHITQAEFDRLGDGSGNGYDERGSGTSYAAPNVAGIVALMLEAEPGLTPALVKEILRFTAERRGDATFPDIDPFWNRNFGWGIVDAYKAVVAVENIRNVNAIDVELQNYITDVVKGDKKLKVAGTAWARRGEVERVDIRIDDGHWSKARPKGDATDPWSAWEAELDISQLMSGSHTVEARAVSWDKYSIADSAEFSVTNEFGLEDLLMPLVVGLFAVTSILLVLKKLKKKNFGMKLGPP